VSGRGGHVVALALLVIWAPGKAAAVDAEPRTAPPRARITVVYDNVPRRPELTTAWGFAAVVESRGETVLFDTGGDGPTLLANLRRLEIAPRSIDAVVISHAHGDHVGGLVDFLAERSGIPVYVTASFPAALRRRAERLGARVETVSHARHLSARFDSTGPLGDGIEEQALIVDSPRGAIVVTGCAHPGIVAIADAARRQTGREIALLVGGFHLLRLGEREIDETVQALRDLGVEAIAPSHCTGEAAIERLRAVFGADFVDSGCGAVIEIP
jgi:7,8-dihydropterin-6-yl-methyl-4-(beta-D-ribofuranosyl)aminobenzene 5'-phosphate synthase